MSLSLINLPELLNAFELDAAAVFQYVLEFMLLAVLWLALSFFVFVFWRVTPVELNTISLSYNFREVTRLWESAHLLGENLEMILLGWLHQNYLFLLLILNNLFFFIVFIKSLNQIICSNLLMCIVGCFVTISRIISIL